MSWNANNWAQLYNDQLIATSTMEQPYDAFTGRAVIYESISATQPFPVDLIVESLDFAFNEHTQTEIHVGNGFSFIAFGKDAMTMSINAALVDTGKNFGKDTFMDIYRNYLRLEAVARRGVAPVFTFPNAAIYGAASAVNFSETGEVQDLVYLTLQLEVMKAVFKSSEDNFMLDYIHGTEFSETSVLTTTGPADVSRETPKIVSKDEVNTGTQAEPAVVPMNG